MALTERDFFDERPEANGATYTCPRCRHRDEYQVRRLKRTKKSRLPAGADERDRAIFAKQRDYLVRVDDNLICKRSRRSFEIPSAQSAAFL